MSLQGALPQRNSGPTFVPLGIKKGLHQAEFIGMSEPFEKYDYFNGCKTCGLKGPEGKYEKGVGCNDCDGTGKLKVMCVHLKYNVDGIEEVQVEEVSYKLSPPGQTKTGKTLSPSTLYLRMRTFFDELDLTDQARAYDAFEEQGFPMPVTLLVDDNQSGKSTKIKAVMKRGD